MVSTYQRFTLSWALLTSLLICCGLVGAQFDPEDTNDRPISWRFDASPVRPHLNPRNMEQRDEMQRVGAVADDAKRYSVIAEDALKLVFPQSSTNNFHVTKLLFDKNYANNDINVDLWEKISAMVKSITDGYNKIRNAVFHPAAVKTVKTGVFQSATVMQDFYGYQEMISQININHLRKYLDDLISSSQLYMQLKMFKALPPYLLNEVEPFMLIRKLSTVYSITGVYNYTGLISEALKAFTDAESPESKEYKTWINHQRAQLKELAALLLTYDVDKAEEACSSLQCMGYTNSANVALWYELYSAIDEQTVLMRSSDELKTAIHLTLARRGNTYYDYCNLSKIACILSSLLPQRVMTQEERHEFEANMNRLRASMMAAGIKIDASAPTATDESIVDHFDPTAPINASRTELTLFIVYTKSMMRNIVKSQKWIRDRLYNVANRKIIQRESSGMDDWRTEFDRLRDTSDIIQDIIGASKVLNDRIDVYIDKYLTSSANEYITEYGGYLILKKAHRVMSNTSAVRGLMLDFYARLNRTFVAREAQMKLYAYPSLLYEVANLVSTSCRALNAYLTPYMELIGAVTMDMAKADAALSSAPPSVSSSDRFEHMRARYQSLKDDVQLVLNQFGDLGVNAERILGLLRFVDGNAVSESEDSREQLWYSYFELREDIHNGILLGSAFESIRYKCEEISKFADELAALVDGDGGSGEASRRATAVPGESTEDSVSGDAASSDESAADGPVDAASVAGGEVVAPTEAEHGDADGSLAESDGRDGADEATGSVPSERAQEAVSASTNDHVTPEPTFGMPSEESYTTLPDETKATPQPTVDMRSLESYTSLPDETKATPQPTVDMRSLESYTSLPDETKATPEPTFGMPSEESYTTLPAYEEGVYEPATGVFRLSREDERTPIDGDVSTGTTAADRATESTTEKSAEELPRAFGGVEVPRGETPGGEVPAMWGQSDEETPTDSSATREVTKASDSEIRKNAPTADQSSSEDPSGTETAAIASEVEVAGGAAVAGEVEVAGEAAVASEATVAGDDWADDDDISPSTPEASGRVTGVDEVPSEVIVLSGSVDERGNLRDKLSSGFGAVCVCVKAVLSLFLWAVLWV
ncbi:hypothetical protein BBBOND_0302040 [Babesia bigemina]|uniref:Uncharacterized protein n=1 Tax=Babesia bigemina TaxID=5866 RepID=A0A061DDJ5_BABBI|nr:hypothetical protein BBBOND_0302040 [Babesia bigemina]CDR96300.1 hypothetical protein BBBOND_0302040 [Babesia bigemina]|eukprot:XP_012768486.1 hypothetical protein BBBOND_0302040 [Babesia bigemina]